MPDQKEPEGGTDVAKFRAIKKRVHDRDFDFSFDVKGDLSWALFKLEDCLDEISRLSRIDL